MPHSLLLRNSLRPESLTDAVDLYPMKYRHAQQKNLATGHTKCRRYAKRRPRQFFIIITIINLRPFTDASLSIGLSVVIWFCLMHNYSPLYTVAAHRFTISAIRDVYTRKRSALSAHSRSSGGPTRYPAQPV